MISQTSYKSTNHYDNIIRRFDDIFVKRSPVIDSLNPYDVIGIDTNQIPDIINSIENFIEDLTYHIDTVTRNIDTTNIYKGKYTAYITDFIEGVKYVITSLISNLRRFETQLNKIEELYNERDQVISKDLSSLIEKSRSLYNVYNEDSSD